MPTDVNECQEAALNGEDICPNRDCSNTVGSFECTCPEGLTLLNETCIFIGTSFSDTY